MGHFSVTFGYFYILLIIDCIFKWVETKATMTNDSKVVLVAKVEVHVVYNVKEYFLEQLYLFLP